MKTIKATGLKPVNVICNTSDGKQITVAAEMEFIEATEKMTWDFIFQNGELKFRGEFKDGEKGKHIAMPCLDTCAEIEEMLRAHPRVGAFGAVAGTYTKLLDEDGYIEFWPISLLH
jgi:hypothetical protein